MAAKTVEIMLRDHLSERAAALGQHMKEQLAALQQRVPGKIREVRGLGLMLGIELTVSGKDVWEELLRRGYICNLSHGVTLRLLPPLNIDQADLDSFVTTLEDILKAF